MIKKNYVVYILVLLLILIISACAGGVSDMSKISGEELKEEEPQEGEELKELEVLQEVDYNQLTPSEFFNKVMSKYVTVLPTGELVYDEQFAGAWYTGDKLNVALTNEISQTDKIPGVIYHLYRFSYNHLLKLRDEIVPLMREYTIFSVGIAPQHNWVDIMLEDESYIENARSSFATRFLYYEESAVRFTVSVMPSFANTHIHGVEE